MKNFNAITVEIDDTDLLEAIISKAKNKFGYELIKNISADCLYFGPIMGNGKAISECSKNGAKRYDFLGKLSENWNEVVEFLEKTSNEDNQRTDESDEKRLEVGDQVRVVKERPCAKHNVGDTGEITAIDLIHNEARIDGVLGNWFKIQKLELISKEEDNMQDVDAPIRVRVDEPEEAELLVALADNSGFVTTDYEANYDGGESVFAISPYKNEKALVVSTHNKSDLTFEDHYKIIKTYLSYHGESEDDECEYDCDEGTIIVNEVRGRKKAPVEKDCPDCTDESEELTKSVRNDVSQEVEANQEKKPFGGYDRNEVMTNQQPPEYRLDDEDEDYVEPRPEDDVQRFTPVFRCLIANGFEKEAEEIIDTVYDLEQELESVRGEREFWIENYHTEQNARLSLLERIEEAKKYIESPQPIRKTKLLNILSRDSDK